MGKYGHSVALWRRFVHYCRHSYWSVTLFTMEAVRDVYRDAISSLHSYRASLASPSYEIEALMVEFFTQLVVIEGQSCPCLTRLRILINRAAQSGFCERAVAMVQALLELNSDDTPRNARLLAAYWEGEGARIGDAGSGGGFAEWLRTGSVDSGAAPMSLDALLRVSKWVLCLLLVCVLLMLGQV